MFYNYNSLSFLLFYVCHLLVTVINGQQHLQQPQLVPQPNQYYGHHKVYSPNGTVLYARSYNLNDAGYTENLFTKPQMYGRSFSQPPQAINHQVRNNQGYSPDGGDEQAFPRFLRYRSITPPPMVAPQIPPQSQLLPQLPQLPPQFPSRLPSPMARPAIPPAILPIVPPPVVSPNVLRYGPVMPQNKFGERAQYQSEYSRNTQRQTVSGNEVTVPHSYNVRDEPTNRMIDYFSSDFFKSNVKENKLTTVSLFQNTIIAKNITADEAIIRANLEKTPGQDFDSGTSDCKPMLTVVKFGNINQPEIIYNPSSVKVYRCPQACFSWQFDCLPVKKTSFNFTAAVYTMERDRVTREVNQFEVDSHTECACQCQTVASCLASPSLSNKRPKSKF